MSTVAEFQESSVPQIVALLSHSDRDVRTAGAHALLKLFKQGKVFHLISEFF